MRRIFSKSIFYIFLILASACGWQNSSNANSIQFKPAIEGTKYKNVQEVSSSIRDRLEQSGIHKPVIKLFGTECILIELPENANKQNVTELLTKTFALELKIDDEPSNSIIITSDMIQDAKADSGGNIDPSVIVVFNEQGSQLLNQLTSHNVGKKLSILLNGKLLVNPIIEAPLKTGKVNISLGYDGDFIDRMEKAEDLAAALKSGTLPIKATSACVVNNGRPPVF